MVALAIIPCGTGNDCARNLGVPLGPISAARLAADGRARSIDLGLIDSAGRRTYFVNVAGVGFDAEVAWRVSRVPRLVGGTRLYVAGVVRALVGWRSPQIRLVIDGEVVDQRVFLAAIANGPSYGGGMRIAPTARFDDGVLDLCIVGEIGRAEVLRLVPRMYSGGHVGHPAVRMMRGVEVSVESGMRVRCHADGEVLGGLPARLTVVPRALSCVLPP
jgi:diacylglycerol kinase (ATP)